MGGVFAALAVVIMNLGGLIPMATYVCPTLCMVILSFVYMACGNRIAWSWYAAVSILSLLMSPDKEAAAVFAFLGYYPILKPRIETMKGKWLWKLAVFNISMVVLYSILIRIMGITEITQRSGSLQFYIESPEPEQIAALSQKYGRRILFSCMEKPFIGVKLLPIQQPAMLMQEVIMCMKGAVKGKQST